jgi:hypothetical protein
MACRTERVWEVYLEERWGHWAEVFGSGKGPLSLAMALLSVVTTDFAELLEDLRLLCSTGFAIT